MKNNNTPIIIAFFVVIGAAVSLFILQQSMSSDSLDGASLDDGLSLSQKEFAVENQGSAFQKIVEKAPEDKFHTPSKKNIIEEKVAQDTFAETKTFVLKGVVYEADNEGGFRTNRQNNPINEFTVEGVENWSYHPTEKNRFEIYRTVPADEYRSDEFSFTVTAEGYASVYKWENRLEEPESQVFVNLSKGDTLTGRLLYADGEPVEGAIVTVECHTCDEDSIVPGVSSQDGKFTIENVPQDKYLTVFVSTSYFDHNISFRSISENKPEHDLGDVILPKRGKLTVRVESHSHTSSAGHNVLVQMNSSVLDQKYHYLYREIPERITNTDGIVEFSNVAYPSYCFVWLDNTLFRAGRMQYEEEEVVFTLHDTVLNGRVTMDGEIPDTLAVSLEGDDQNFRATYTGSKVEPELNFSAYDGAYEFQGIPDGRYELEIEVLPEEYENPSAKIIAKYDIQIEEGKTVTIDHDFKTSALRVKVTDSEGRPIEGAYLTTRTNIEDVSAHKLVSWEGQKYRSDNQGKLIIDKLIQAPYKVVAYYKNFKSNPIETETLLPGDQNSEITIKLPYDQESRIVIRFLDEETESLIEDIESIYILFDTQTDGRVYVDEITKLEEPGTFEVRGIPKENNFTIEYDFKSGWVPAYYHESDFPGGLKPFQKPEDNEPLDFYLTKKSILDITHMGGGPNSFDNFAPVYELSRVRKDGFIEILEHVGKDRRYVNLEAGIYHLSVFNGDEEYHFQEVEIRPGEYKRINVGPPN